MDSSGFSAWEIRSMLLTGFKPNYRSGAPNAKDKGKQHALGSLRHGGGMTHGTQFPVIEKRAALW
jgi:hypothetical protein